MVDRQAIRDATIARLSQSADPRSCTERLRAVGVRHEPDERHTKAFFDMQTGEALGCGDVVAGWALVFEREDAAKAAGRLLNIGLKGADGLRIGARYETVSGMGGTFTVKLLSLTEESGATVRVCESGPDWNGYVFSVRPFALWPYAKHGTGYVVGWINPEDRTQAGEFRGRYLQPAQSFADAKRAAGCEVEQLRG